MAKTREEWLVAATDRIRIHAMDLDVNIPANVRVSIGFPSSRARGSKSGRVVGQCFHPPASADATFEIFISPVHETSESILSTLVHELSHAAASPSRGHRSAFQFVASKLDLVGPWPSAGFPEGMDGKFLPAWAAAILADLGPIPHARLDPGQLAKKQTTRMVKLECFGCGYLIRTTAKWIAFGVPTCPCGKVFEVTEAPAEVPQITVIRAVETPVYISTPAAPAAPAPVAQIPLKVRQEWILEDILEGNKLAKHEPRDGEVVESFATPEQIAKDRNARAWEKFYDRPRSLDPKRLPA